MDDNLTLLKTDVRKGNKSNLYLSESFNAAASEGLQLRNKWWKRSNQIPGWVNIEQVGLDQFFTRSHVAKACWKSLLKYIKADGGDVSQYIFIEPSAGL